MAKQNLSDLFNRSYVTKHKTHNGNDGGWLANAIKSVGYSASDVVSDILPATMGTIKTVSENSKDIIDQMRQSKSQLKRLTKSFEQNAYIGMGKDMFKNALEDLKSGKFYNKDRESKSGGSGSFGFNESDFDFEVPDFDDGNLWGDTEYDVQVSTKDGSTSVGLNQTSEKGVNSTVTNVSTKVDDDSAMVGAISAQTKVSTMNASMIVDVMKRQHVMTSQTMNNIYNGMMSGLSTLNDNVTQFTPVITKSLDNHIQLSSKFFNDSIELLTAIKDELIKGNKTSTNDPNEVNRRKDTSYTDASDLFDFETGMLNFKDYIEYVKGNIKKSADDADNEIISIAKMLIDNKDVLFTKDMVEHPLKFISDGIVKTLIPKIAKDAASAFDETFKTTSLALLYGIGNYKNSNNTILSTLGQMLGIHNSLSTSIDKSNYKKGPVSWTGKSDKTLNEVIPTYLRKILSAITTSEEMVMDYNSGRWASIEDIQSDFSDTYNRMMLGGGEFSDFFREWRSFLRNFQFGGDKQEIQAIDYAENFIRNLIRHDGLMGPDINSLRSLTGSLETDPLLQMLSGFLNSQDNNFVMKLFSEKQLAARRNITQYIKRLNNNDTADPNGLQYISTGLIDNPMFIRDAINGNIAGSVNNRYITGEGSSSGTGYTATGLSLGIRDQFGRSGVFYTRQILELLLDGIDVRVVETVGRGRGRHKPINHRPDSPHSKISNKLKTDNDRFIAESNYVRSRREDESIPDSEELAERRGTRHIDLQYSEITAEEVQRIIEKQRKDDKESEDLYREMQAEMYGDTSIRHALGLDKGTKIGDAYDKIIGYIKQPAKIAADLFKRADNFLFELVFGKKGNQITSGSLLERGVTSIKKTVMSFGSWMNKAVVTPLSAAFFGDDGFITKLKDSEFGNDAKNYLTKAKEFVFGTPDENNVNQGGLLSGIANEVKDAGKYVRNLITGKSYVDQYGVEHPENENSLAGKIKDVFNESTGFIKRNIFGVDDSDNGLTDIDEEGKPLRGKNTIVNAINSIWLGIKHRASTFSEDVFGKDTERKKAMDQFKYDMKGNGAKIGAGALLGTLGAGILSGIGGLGLAGSLLLSPLGGAAIGMTAAITAKSSQFQRLMFGDIDENGERTGGLITKGMQDFVKKGLPGIVGGGLIAGTLSTMGALPELGLVGSMLLPGGPVLTGALVGGASLLGFKATNFGKALFGDNDGSKESFADTFKRVFTKDNIKKYVGDTAVGGLLGKLTFNSLVSAGLLPSFFLPGGPIVGALFGLSTSIVSNSDKFRTFMFGKKDEETGEREGGVMGKIKNALTGVGEWVSTTFQVYQENLIHAVKKGIMIPIQTTIDPFVEEIKELTTRIGDKLAGIYETTIGYIKDSVKEYIIKPIAEATKPIRDALKRAGSFIFGMFKKMLTGLVTLPAKIGMTAITMPFRLAGRIFGVDANTYTKRRARREFRHETLDAATGIRDRYDAYRRQYAGADQTDDKIVRKGLLKDFVAGRGDSQSLREQNRTRTLFGIKDNATGKMIKEVNDDGTVTGGIKSGLLYKFLFDNAYWKAGTNKETYHIYNKKTGMFEDREYGADYEDPKKQKKELNKEENQRHKDEIARIKNRPGTRKWAKNIHKQAVAAYDNLSDYDKENLDISKEDFIKQTEKRLKNGENGPWWRADTPEERAKKDEERMKQAQLRNEQMQDTVNNNLPVLTEIGEDIRDTLQGSADSQSVNDTSHDTMDSVDVPDSMVSTLSNLDDVLQELNETIARSNGSSHGTMDSIDIPDTQQSNDQASDTTTVSANRATRRRNDKRRDKNNKTTVATSTNQSVPEVDPLIALTDINEDTPTHADGTEHVEKTQLAILSEGEKVVPNPDNNQREKGRKSEKSLKDKLVQGKDTFVSSINKLSQVATTLNENLSQKKNETNFSVKDFASFVAQSLLEDPIGFIRDVVKAPFELVGNMVKRAGEKVYEHILSPVIEVVKEPFVAVKEAISETIDETVNMIISPFKKMNDKLASAVDTVMFGILHPFKTIEAGASALNDVFGDNPLISKLNSFINGSPATDDETNNANGEILSDTLKQDLSDTTEYGENVDTIVKADQITFKDQTEFNDERDAKKSLSEKIKSAQEAGSYLTVKAKADEEARQKDIVDKLANISQHTSDTAETSAKHSISWDSIFSKKGLITGALLAAIPAIIALINKLFGGDGDGGGNGFLQNLLQNAGATIKWLFNNWGDGDTTVEDINGDGDISNYERSLQDLNYGVYSVGGATGVANNISEGVNNFTDMAEGLLTGEGFSAIDNYIAPDGEWNNASDVKAKVAARTAIKVGRVGKKAVTKLATKDGTLLNTVIKMCSKGLTALGGAVGKAVSKVGAKVGSTKAGQIVSKILAKVSSKLLKPNVLSKFLGKFGKAVAKLAGDVGTAGLIEIGFVAAGAVNGAYSAANLFQVNSDAVDGKMRVISAAIEAVLMTSVGTFIDVLDTISMEVLGYSFVSEIAVSAYNALATDDEEAALLAERTEFKDDYEAYIDQEYQNYLQENGLTEEDMSKDEYRASEDATSFSDYNSQVNKTLGGKISDGLKNIGSSIKNGVSSIGEGATKLANNVKSFANTVKGLFNKKLSGWYDHDTGSYYVLNDSGNAFDEYSAAGDKIGEGLDYDEIMLKIKSGRLSEGKVVAKGETLVKIGEYVDNVRKNISNGLGNLSVKLNDKMTEAKQFWADLKNGISIQKEAVHNYFNSHTESGWYDAQDGTYYVLNSDGSSYDKYSANGDKIGEGISTETVRDMASSGMLVESEVNINSGISQSALGKCFTNIKDFFTNIGSSVSDLWSNAKEKVLSKLNNLKTTIVSKFALFKFIKNISVPSKTEAWFDSNGNYYVMNSDGTYTYYNSNGGIITKNVDGETVEEFKRMGLLTLSDIQTKPPAATFISNIKNAAKSAWEAASIAAKSAWEAIKNAFTGGYGDLKNKSSDIKKAIAQENATTITDAITSNGSGPGIKNPKPLHTGGFGGDDAIGSNKSVDSVNTKQIASATASNNFVDKIKDKSVNDTTMSQKDAAVANIQFNNPDDTIKQTIGDSGCGPVVASNLINSLTGNKSISVKEAADYAVDNGYKAKDGGTAPTYFGSIFSKYGIGTKPVYNIPKQLEDGKPIIMLGDTNTPSSRTPFGTVPHYVVAMGMSDDGKVIIQDPLKKSGYQKYKLSELGNIYNSIALDYDSSKSRTKFSKTPVYDIDMSNMPYGKGGTPLTGDECAVQDLRVFNPLTAQDIEDTVGKVHKNCYWTGYGYTFIQASKVAGIDPRFLVSLAINEAGWNPINRHKSIHNYFSINMPDGDVDHGTPLGNNIEEGIVNGALWIAKNYVHNTERNQYTIRKMRLGANESGNHCYNTRQQWEDLVAKIMAYFPRISNYDTSNPFDTGKSSSYTGDSKWAGSYSSTAPDGSTNVISAGTTTEQQTTSGGRSIASALSNFASAATKPVLDYLLGEETTTVDSSSFSSIDTSDTAATDEVPEEETTETTTTTNKNKNTESNAKANMSTTIDAYFKSMIGKASGKYDKVSHPGVDYMGDKFVNSPIAGKKVKEGKDDVRGRFVIIRDSTGHYHRFFNMYAGIQKFPTDISVGTGLGRTGKTIKKEASKGEHLHYEYADAMQGGNTRDPATVKLNNFGGKGDLANSISSDDAPDLLNGFAYYSQNDPRFANESYKLSNDYDDENNDSQTIAVRGCGPTSLAMVASQLTGKSIDPVSLANIATNNNYSTDVGTTPEYFNDVGTGLGLSVHQQASTKNNLINALSSNSPVILQGNSNNSDTPYTNRGHYVVATGMRNGKITINDPRGQMTSGEYDIKDVLNGSGAMWSFDNTGKNLNQIDKLDNPDDVYGNSGIYPDMVNGHIYFNQTDDRWGNKVYAGGSLFRNSGCVVTAIAQTASDVTGKRIEPPEAAATMAGAFNGGSIIWEPAMEKMKAKYGLNYEIYYGPGKGGHKAAEVSEYIKSKLSQNIPVVMHGKYSKRPGNGEHALEAIGLTNDDRVILQDVGEYTNITSKMPDAAWKLSDMAIHNRTNIAMTDSNGGGSKGTNVNGSSTSSDATTGTSSSGSMDTGTSSRSLSGVLSSFASAATDPIMDYLLGEDTSATDTSTTSSSTGVNSADTELSGSTNKAQIWNYFKGRNYSDNLAAGIMGNMERESGYDWSIMEGMKKSTAVPYNRGGYGLIQWTGAQSQRIANNQALKESNDQYGLNSLKGQLSVVSGTLEQRPVYVQSGGLTEGCNGSAFNIYKFKGKYGDDYFNKINNMSVHDATKAFHDCVEISADSNMNLRYKFADGVLSQFGGKTNVGGNGGLGGFGDGTHQSTRNYKKPPIHKISSNSLNKYKKPVTKSMKHNYVVGGFGEPVQQINVNTTNDNSDILGMMKSLLVELKSTNTGINKFNEKELSVNNTTNSPIINNTTNNNITQSPNISGSKTKSFIDFDTNKYRIAKQIASGKTH